jgi:hypothetical protein
MAQTPPAQSPSAQTPPSAQGHAPGATQRPADAPDDEFIEFLGEDDHGDSAWWEFLKKTPPGDQNPAQQQSPKQ